MSKYAGQKVRFVGKSDESFTNGKIYEACERAYGEGHVSVVVDDNGDENGWIEKHFELATTDTPHIVADSTGPMREIYTARSYATAAARDLAERNPGTEYAIYARVAGYRADKPVAMEVA